MAQSTQTSTNWLRNPNNKKQAYAEAALPQLLFRECLLNCVDGDKVAPETAPEKACISNCQEKTY